MQCYKAFLFAPYSRNRIPVKFAIKENLFKNINSGIQFYYKQSKKKLIHFVGKR